MDFKKPASPATASALSSASDSPSPPQPLKETKGAKKELSILVVACKQCRSRKVRCDSGRPQCKNCVRRCDPCEYDNSPKRRGPDKLPGARTRMYKKKPEGIDRVERPAKRIQRTAPAAEGRVSGDNQTGTSGSTPTDSYREEQISSLFSASLEDVASILPSQVPQDAPSVFIDDADLDDTLRAAGFASLERFLSTEQSAFSNRFDPLPAKLITSVNQVPQLWSQNIPSSIYQASQYYQAYGEDPFTDFIPTSFIPRGPSMAFYKQTWWDSLMPLYSTDPSQSAMRIYQDLNFLLNNAIYWFSFINLPWLMSNLFDPHRRTFMQPSVVLSALALATLMKSSEAGMGAEGRRFAEWLRDAAQSSLEASLSASWIEPSLAQAAFFLTLFEASAHPNHNSARTQSALFLLDALIQGLSLTKMDAHEIDANHFPADDMPHSSRTKKMLISPAPQQQNEAEEFPFASESDMEHVTCGCATHRDPPALPPYTKNAWLTTGPVGMIHDAQQFQVQDTIVEAGLNSEFLKPSGFDKGEMALAAAWRRKAVVIDWPDQRDFGEIQKEESRRLCWASMILASGLGEFTPHLVHQSWDLYITRQENFALYYPGEVTTKQGAKNSIWALHCRAALLWNACQRLRSQPDWHQRRPELTATLWMEANELERSLTHHKCPLGRGVLFAGREYLFQLKMVIGDNFTHRIPMPHTLTFERDSAQEWLGHRDILAAHVRKLIYFVERFGPNACGLALAKRPLSIWWAMHQIRAGTLAYKSDPTLHAALTQSLEFLAIVDFLTAMWPSPEQTLYYAQVRKDLLDACAEAGVSVPDPVPIPGLPTKDLEMIPSPFLSKKASAADIPIAPLD